MSVSMSDVVVVALCWTSLSHSYSPSSTLQRQPQAVPLYFALCVLERLGTGRSLLTSRNFTSVPWPRRVYTSFSRHVGGAHMVCWYPESPMIYSPSGVYGTRVPILWRDERVRTADVEKGVLNEEMLPSATARCAGSHRMDETHLSKLGDPFIDVDVDEVGFGEEWSEASFLQCFPPG